MQRIALALLIAVSLAALGCGSDALTLTAAPWSDGEVTHYTRVSAAGRPTGTSTWTWRKAKSNWTLHEKRTATWGEVDTKSVVSSDLEPLSVTQVEPEKTVTVTYAEQSIEIGRTSEGKTERASLDRPRGTVVDNELLLQLLRAAPLDASFAASFHNVVAGSSAAMPADVRVTASEEVRVPAGAFDTWHVELGTALGTHHAWYTKEAPHLLVKYENPHTQSELRLRAWQPQQASRVIGAAKPPKLEAPGGAPFRIGIVLTSLVIGVPVMVAVPLWLGFFLRRKLGVGLRVFWAGALTFVLSQVVHLPLNWAIGLLGGQRWAGLLPLVWLALVAGLSAGLCEELARYGALRFAMKKTPKTWSTGLQFGAGHGGIESMLLGVMALSTVGGMLVLHWLPPESLGLQGHAAAQVGAVSDAFWVTPAYLGLVGAGERLMAMTAHIAMTLLVVASIAKRKPIYLLAAIAAHTALDMWAVWAVARLGVAWTEGGIAVFAMLFLVIVVKLRPAHASASASALVRD